MALTGPLHCRQAMGRERGLTEQRRELPQAQMTKRKQESKDLSTAIAYEHYALAVHFTSRWKRAACGLEETRTATLAIW
jgi:hypothetical protein